MLALIKQFVGSIFSKDLGIDLGTSNTVVYVRGEGIILSEPSVVAVRKGTNQIIMNGQAVGNIAKEMLGKASNDKIVVTRPLKDGVVTDFDITSAMISYFIRKVHKSRFGVLPRVVIAVPSGITTVEKRAVVNAAEQAGARNVYLIEEPVAAAIGAELPILDSVGSMIIDIGGGTTEVAILSCGVVTSSRSLRIAGDEMDESIIQYIKQKYGLLIGEQTAEKIKIQIGSAIPLPQEKQMNVRGLDIISRMPREILITSQEVREALQGPISQIICAIKETLDRALPEIAADLMEQGICLCGGGALLKNIDKVIQDEINIPVRISNDPLTCVAKGTGAIIEELEKFKITLESNEDIR